jgi:hypothetical protein
VLDNKVHALNQKKQEIMVQNPHVRDPAQLQMIVSHDRHVMQAEQEIQQQAKLVEDANTIKSN